MSFCTITAEAAPANAITIGAPQMHSSMPAPCKGIASVADFRLFDTSLYSAQREDFRDAIAVWSAPMRDNQNPLCDSYDAKTMMGNADILEFCYNDQGFVQTIRFPPYQMSTQKKVFLKLSTLKIGWPSVTMPPKMSKAIAIKAQLVWMGKAQ